MNPYNSRVTVTKVVIGKRPEDSKVIIDRVDELDGVMAITVHQDAGALPRLILQIELTNVEITRE